MHSQQNVKNYCGITGYSHNNSAATNTLALSTAVMSAASHHFNIQSTISQSLYNIIKIF